MDLWLTSNELSKLTGRIQSAAQIRWLRRNRIRHLVNADNDVIVLKADLAPPAERRPEPRLEAVRRAS